VTPTSPPTATPADTPTVTPTPTPRYTLNPAKPPEPITFCAYTEIRVNVLDYDGLPKQGVSVHIWSTDLSFDTTVTTDVMGYADKRIADDGYFDATWYVQLLEGGVPASDVKTFATSSKCKDDDEVTSGYPTVWVLHFKATGR
jgi:hypothetical protein